MPPPQDILEHEQIIELSFEWIHWTIWTIWIVLNYLDSQSICHLQTITLFDTEIKIC